MKSNLIFVAPYMERVHENDFVTNLYEVNFSANGLNLPEMEGEAFFKFLEANNKCLREFGCTTSIVDLFEEEEEMRVNDCRGLNLYVTFHLKGDNFGKREGKVLFAYSIMEEHSERTRAFLCCERGGVFLYDLEYDAFYMVGYPEKDYLEKVAKRIFGEETTVSADDNCNNIKVFPSKTSLNDTEIEEFTKLALVASWTLTNGTFETTFNL